MTEVHFPIGILYNHKILKILNFLMTKTSQSMVSLLNTINYYFFHSQQVETIGDAYVVASGKRYIHIGKKIFCSNGVTTQILLNLIP